MWLSRLKAARRRAEESRGARQELSQEQSVVLLCHGSDASGLNVMRNAIAALQTSRISFAVINLAFNHPWPALDRFSAMVICTDRLSVMTDKAETLTRWIDAGGGILFAIRAWRKEFSALLGLALADPPRIEVSSGLRFIQEVMPGAKGLVIEPEAWRFHHQRLAITASDLDPGCQVLVQDLTENPVAWRYERGAGRVVVWNTHLLQARGLRGVLLQGILDVMGTAVASILGLATVHIDDFPPPPSAAPARLLEDEFPGKDMDAFFYGPWLQDMLALREKYNLRYSWYAVMDYADESGKPPDPAQIPAARAELMDRFTRAGPLPEEDELGFHGYNHRQATHHQTPDLDLYRTQIELARDMWIRHVPAPLPKSWVPAGNQFHEPHIRIVSEVFPEITSVASLHSFGDPELGCYREFGTEPLCPEMVNLPRNNFGYFLGQKQKFLLLTQIAGFGLWSHFLHPDDVFDIPTGAESAEDLRNPGAVLWNKKDAAGRPGLFQEFEAFVDYVCHTFPWLRFVTTSEAVRFQTEQSKARARISLGPDMIDIECPVGGKYFVHTRAGFALRNSAGNGHVICEHPVCGGLLSVVDCQPGHSSFQIRQIEPKER